jgi:hypothetical protein
MSSTRPVPIAIAAGIVFAVGAVVVLVGIVPALVLLWTGSLIGVFGVFRYEGREQPNGLAVVPLEPLATVAPASESPLVDLADSGADGSHGRLTHRHRRHRSHNVLRTRV